MINKIGILTSGGDSPGMNAALRSVTRCALNSGVSVVAIKDGYKGLIEENFVEFNNNSVSDILWRGGTIIGSARLPEFKKDEVVKEAATKVKEEGIEGIVVIGGDGSYRGALALVNEGINCVCLPGTIDNDVNGTDFTIGFDTALDTIVGCIDKLKDTSSSHHRCSVVEVMGNHCGDLALYSGIATGAEIVVTPETSFDEKLIMEKLRMLDVAGKNHAIVVVSEKITDVQELASKISEETGFSGRATVLGHIQRGGSPTTNDRVLASRMGEKAVELLMEEVIGHAIGIKNNKIISNPIEEVLKMEKENKESLYKLFDKLV